MHHQDRCVAARLKGQLANERRAIRRVQRDLLEVRRPRRIIGAARIEPEV
jgi:hypothetical protein